MIQGMPNLPECHCGEGLWKEGSESLSCGSHQAQYQCMNCKKMAIYFHSGQCTFFLISDSREEMDSWITEFNQLMKQGWEEFRKKQKELEETHWLKLCVQYNAPYTNQGINDIPDNLRETFIKLHTEFLNSEEYFFPEGLKSLRPKQKLGEFSAVYFFNRKEKSWQ